MLDYYNVRSIKDSFTFVDKIRKIGVPRDGYMCSFDVVKEVSEEIWIGREFTDRKT